jgi:hypothetical protein
MIAIARSDGLVCLTDLATVVGVQNVSRIQAAIAALKVAGLLVDTESGDSRRRWMRRTTSSCWGWVLELAEEHGYAEGEKDSTIRSSGASTR